MGLTLLSDLAGQLSVILVKNAYDRIIKNQELQTSEAEFELVKASFLMIYERSFDETSLAKWSQSSRSGVFCPSQSLSFWSLVLRLDGRRKTLLDRQDTTGRVLERGISYLKYIRSMVIKTNLCVSKQIKKFHKKFTKNSAFFNTEICTLLKNAP